MLNQGTIETHAKVLAHHAEMLAHHATYDVHYRDYDLNIYKMLYHDILQLCQKSNC